MWNKTAGISPAQCPDIPSFVFFCRKSGSESIVFRSFVRSSLLFHQRHGSASKCLALRSCFLLGCLKMSAFSLLHKMQPAILHLIDHIAGPRDVLRAVAGQQDGLVLRLEALEQVMHLLHGCLVHRVERLI